jgi:hypothetical protein
LLQDSTTLHLPDCMKRLFKGNVSRGATKALAKLNLIMDVFSGRFLLMRWMSYTVTEQSLSGSILEIARAGDLVIRDLGYSVLKTFQTLSDESIFFLSRLKYNLALFDAQTGQPFKIHRALKRKSSIDCWVCCGNKERVQARLVAIPLSPQQAAARRRKARQDRDQRLNHSKQYYFLLGYLIFITTVDETIWSRQQVAEAYRIRWNIEIVFKSWKSGLNIKDLIPDDITRTERIESILYLMMLYVIWFQLLAYLPVKCYAEKRGGSVSILKLAKRILTEGIRWLFEGINVTMKKLLMKQCRYDVRHDKLNASERLDLFYASLA